MLIFNADKNTVKLDIQVVWVGLLQIAPQREHPTRQNKEKIHFMKSTKIPKQRHFFHPDNIDWKNKHLAASPSNRDKLENTVGDRMC